MSALRAILEHLTIVPEVHVRLFDVRLQWQMYEIFHETALSRLLHALFTPVIVAGWIALASGVALGPLDLGWVLVVVLGVSYVQVDTLAAGLLSVGLVAIKLGWSALDLPPVATGLTLLVAGSVLQASGHLVEPIPPPWGGQRSFVSMRTLFQEAPLYKTLLLPALALAGFVLESWAALRVWPYQVLIGLSALGWRTADRAVVLASLQELRSNGLRAGSTAGSAGLPRPPG